MDHKNKFAAETVLQLQQSLDEVPAYQATELSKQQTIRTLSPQIFALRSKGYSWLAVAELLSKRGVPVSVAALRTYLRRVREEATDEKPRTQTKRLRDVGADTRQPERVPPITHSPSHNGETQPARKPLQPGAPPASAVAVQPAPVPGTRREQEPRRSTFALRPDKEEIWAALAKPATNAADAQHGTVGTQDARRLQSFAFTIHDVPSPPPSAER
jgi:hypothetical protein